MRISISFVSMHEAIKIEQLINQLIRIITEKEETSNKARDYWQEIHFLKGTGVEHGYAFHHLDYYTAKPIYLKPRITLENSSTLPDGISLETFVKYIGLGIERYFMMYNLCVKTQIEAKSQSYYIEIFRRST